MDNDAVRERAIQKVDRFERDYGLAMLDFACHAAFPLTLTTEVGYLLRQEYFPALGWSVAGELLLSSLCEVAGYDLYVMAIAVRAVLLERLVDRFGAERVDELAGWMARYIQHRLAIEPSGRAKVLGYPSHWTALACLKGDDEVTRSIQAELSRLLAETDDPSERFRLSALMERQGDLLAARGLQPLKLKELAAQVSGDEPIPAVGDEMPLVGLRSVRSGKVWALQGNLIKVGLYADNDVVLDDPGVSRRHAEFFVRGVGKEVSYCLRDVSRYGSWVLDEDREWQKINHAEVEIRVGMRVKFGGSRNPEFEFVDLDPNVLREFEFEVVKLDDRGNISSQITEIGSYFIEPLGPGVKPLELVAIRGGRFLMGSPDSESERLSREGPQREVTVPPFFMSKYQVMQAQWRFVAETLPEVARSIDPNPSNFEGDDNPVEQVSWLDVQEFCARMTVLAGRTCRLPSEAEWEYACRAPSATPFHFGETISPEVANYDGSATPYEKGKKGVDRNQTIPVGSLNFANYFGLYDMHGNVWEWCEDDFHDNYEGAPDDGSARKDASNDSGFKILRGGSWIDGPRDCRSAYRIRDSADARNYYSGFRVVYPSASLRSP